MRAFANAAPEKSVLNLVSTQQFSRSYNDSSSGVNLTPYSGVIFRGVVLTPKRSLKNPFQE